MMLGAGLLASGQVADAVGSAGSTQQVAEGTYVVRSGDTLWAIASTLAPGRDPRPVIQVLKEANGIGAGSLAPGSVLRIPSLI